MAFLGTACVTPGAVLCDDGRTCPAGTTCDDTRSLCLTQEQTEVCNREGIANGDVCVADGTAGICDRSLCEPGCGDGTTDPNEQCDDGNFASHDGCSSRCEVEVPTWIPYVPAWHGISGHMAAYHPNIGTGRTVLFGGNTTEGLSHRIWQHDPLVTDEPQLGWRDITAKYSSDRPPARINGAMVYDPNRNVLVLFGGATSGFGAVEDYITETWEYGVGGGDFNGEPVGTWVKSSSTLSPTPRLYPAMAYDHNLGKVVLLGGIDPTITDPMVSPFNAEMWAYDGQWTKITPSSGTFPPRARAMLTFDTTRDRLVYFGGGAVDTSVYEYDGIANTWTSSGATSGPGPRRNASFAFDPDRGTCILFGGTIGATNQVASDTWEWTGTTFQLGFFSAANPPGRRSGGFVLEPTGLLMIGGQRLEGEPFIDAWQFSSANGWVEQTPRFGPGIEADSQGAYSHFADGVLVTGGLGSSSVLGETWLFDGNEWRHLADLPSSEVRYGNSTIVDPERDRFLTFGGTSNADGDMDGKPDHHVTLWQLPATGAGSWTQVPTPAGAPAGRVDAAAVHDPPGRRVVVFGGFLDDMSRPAETLFYDGSAWTSSAGAHPAPTFRPAAGWDPERKVVIAFDVAGDTWELEGTTWTNVIPAGMNTPPGRELAIFTYDRFRKRFVLAGGLAPALGGGLDDVWELDPATRTWSRLFVAGAGPLPLSDTLVATYHDNVRGIVIHGGRNGSGLTQGSTWILKYLSNTPDENCTDLVDTDFDAQEDDEDPDCSPLPPP